jgi:hypothetical protein
MTKIEEWLRRHKFTVGLLAYLIGLLMIVQGLSLMLG